MRRWGARVAAVALLGLATTAEGMMLSETSLKFGTTFSDFGPTCETLSVRSTRPWTVERAPDSAWHPGLTITPMGGAGPLVVRFCMDRTRANSNEVHTTRVLFRDADGTVTLPIRTSCSSNSKCGQPEHAPTERPAPVETALRTATPLPGQPTATVTPRPTGTAQPTFTSVEGSTPVRTATAIRTATVVPTRTATPLVPTAQPTSVPGARPVAQPGRALTVVRPMPYRFVSYRNDFAKPRKWAYFLDGTVTTADNASMDAQEHVRLSAVQELTALLDDWRYLGCFDEVQETIAVSQGISHIYRDLMGPYQVAGKLNDGVKGTWADEDAYYNIAGYSMRRYRRCLLDKDTVAACALLPTEYLEFLDLRAEGGRCVEGALFTLPSPPVFDKTQQNLGPLTADRLMPALSPSQLALLNAPTASHTCASLAVLDGRGCTGGTQEKLRQLEASGLNAEQRHALQLAPFPRRHDARWPAREHRAIVLGELYTWGDGSGSMPFSWDGQQRGHGNWGFSRAAEFAHLIYHAISAHMWVREFNGTWVDRSPPYLYRFPCFVRGKFTYGNDCPEESQAAIVNRALRGDYGIYTPGRQP